MGATTVANECCQCCACCGLKVKGWLLLFFSSLAVLFAVGALAAPWYLIYDETPEVTVSTYYQWSGLLKVAKRHDNQSDSSTTYSWDDVHMPQTYTLFMTTLVLAVTSLALTLILIGCVLCIVLLPAYGPSYRFVMPRSSVNKRKWKWVFGLAVLGCFIALLLSFTLILQLPECFAKDLSDHCTTNECDSFIGGNRQKGGYLHIYTPFVGWGSAIASCVFVVVIGTLFLVFFGRKKGSKRPTHALSAINSPTENSGSESTTSSTDDEDAGERRPLLAGEKAERARKADSPGNGGLYHRSPSTRASPKTVEDAPLDESDSPLSYHNPCPPSPSPARIQPLSDLPTSPASARLAPPSEALPTNLSSRFAAVADEPTTQTSVVDEETRDEREHAEEGTRKTELERDDKDDEHAKNQLTPETSESHSALSNTNRASEEAPVPELAALEAEADGGKEARSDGSTTGGTEPEERERTDGKEQPDIGKEEKAGDVAGPAPEQAAQEAARTEEGSADGGAQGETKEEKSEEEQESKEPSKPTARRAFATMQRLSYKDYAKKKAPAPTPESVLGPSRVRGVPNRMALRARGAPLSSIRDQVHTASPSRSATMPPSRRPASSPPSPSRPVGVDPTNLPDDNKEERGGGEERRDAADNAATNGTIEADSSLS